MGSSLFGSVTELAKAWASRRTFSKSAEKRLYSAVAVMQNLESRQLLSSAPAPTPVSPFPGPTIVNPEVKSAIGHNEQPFAVAVADINGDGIPDVITANYDGTVTIMTQYSDQHGRGTGELYYNSKTSTISDGLGQGEGNAHDLAVETAPDGDPLIIVSRNGSEDISVIVGDGHGGFNSAYTVYASSGGVDGLAFTLNDYLGFSSSDTDVVTANHDGTVSLINDVYGTGGANFHREVTIESGTALYSPEDINLDEGPGPDTGLALLDANGNLLEVNTDGVKSTIQQNVDAFAVGNLNPSSSLSDIVALSTYSGGHQSIEPFIGGAGHLTAGTEVTLAYHMGNAINLADINGDGNLDAVVTKYQNNNLYGGPSGNGIISQVGFTGNGSGGFSSSPTFMTTAFGNNSTQYVDSIALADMNGDGKADLVFGYYNFDLDEGLVGIRLNAAPTLAPTITSPDIAFFQQGSNDSFTIKTTGAPQASIYYSGSLPQGLTFTDDGNGTATITGDTTSVSEEVQLTLYAHNGIGSRASQTFLLDVLAPTTANRIYGETVQSVPILPGGYSGTLTAVNYSSLETHGIALEGDPADGYTLETDQYGITTPAGKYEVDISATNGVGSPATEEFTLNVVAPVIFTSADDVAFAKGVFGSFTISTNSSPVPGDGVTLTQITGALPPGMELANNGNGTDTIAGTPTKDGHYSITIEALNGISANSVQSINITVEHARKPTINLKDPTFQLGTPAYYAISTTGYPSVPLGNLNVTGLPPGLTFTDNGDGTGEITGTPTETGYYTLTFTASNSIGSTQKSLKVLVAQPVVFTSADEATFFTGEDTSFLLTATGFPFADIDLLGNLPPGLKIRDDGPNQALIFGTPKKVGVYHFTLLIGTGGDIKQVRQAFTLTVDAGS